MYKNGRRRRRRQPLCVGTSSEYRRIHRRLSDGPTSLSVRASKNKECGFFVNQTIDERRVPGVLYISTALLCTGSWFDLRNCLQYTIL